MFFYKINESHQVFLTFLFVWNPEMFVVCSYNLKVYQGLKYVCSFVFLHKGYLEKSFPIKRKGHFKEWYDIYKFKNKQNECSYTIMHIIQYDVICL